MRRRLRKLFLLTVPLALAACAPGGPSSQPSGETSKPTRGPERTLAVAVRAEPSSIAATAPDAGGIKLKTSVRMFNAGLELVDHRGVAQPYLAEALPQLNTDSWQLLPDGRMETRYRLRPGLTWHDGTPFSAEDFVFAWQTWSAPEMAAFASGQPVLLMEEALAPDDRTLVIRWRRPFPQAGVLQEGGSLRFAALPRHIFAATVRDGQWDVFEHHPFWTRDFVGLGPFKLERWEAGAFIEGIAFDRHVLGRPKIDRLKITFVGDGNAGLASLLAGAIHLAADSAVDFEQGLTAKREWAPNAGGTLLITTDVWRAVHAQFRPDYVEPRGLLDLRVRKALAHTLDKQTLNDALFGGEAIMAETIIPPSLAYYSTIDRAVVKYAYDLRRAEQLMAEVGYAKDADGFYASASEGRFRPEIKTNASSQNESERSLIAAGWRQAGFDIQEATVSVAQARDNQVRATYRSLYNYGRGLGEGILPNFLSTAIASADNRWTANNRSGWGNAEYDRLVDVLGGTLDSNARADLLARIARLTSEELPYFSLYYDLAAVPHTSAVTGPVQVSPETTGLVAWNVYDWELR
jgi:peptide/nickel transport system substrate-binding protein